MITRKVLNSGVIYLPDEWAGKYVEIIEKDKFYPKSFKKLVKNKYLYIGKKYSGQEFDIIEIK